MKQREKSAKSDAFKARRWVNEKTRAFGKIVGAKSVNFLGGRNAQK